MKFGMIVATVIGFEGREENCVDRNKKLQNRQTSEKIFLRILGIFKERKKRTASRTNRVGSLSSFKKIAGFSNVQKLSIFSNFSGRCRPDCTDHRGSISSRFYLTCLSCHRTASFAFWSTINDRVKLSTHLVATVHALRCLHCELIFKKPFSQRVSV